MTVALSRWGAARMIATLWLDGAFPRPGHGVFAFPEAVDDSLYSRFMDVSY